MTTFVCQASSKAIERKFTHSHLAPGEGIDYEAYRDLYPAITTVGRKLICLSDGCPMIVELSDIASWQRRPPLRGLPFEHQKN